MKMHFYRASVDGCFCVFENIFVNIPKTVIFLLYKNSAEYFLKA